jgi:hypothetical protein
MDSPSFHFFKKIPLVLPGHSNDLWGLTDTQTTTDNNPFTKNGKSSLAAQKPLECLAIVVLKKSPIRSKFWQMINNF